MLLFWSTLPHTSVVLTRVSCMYAGLPVKILIVQPSGGVEIAKSSQQNRNTGTPE